LDKRKKRKAVLFLCALLSGALLTASFAFGDGTKPAATSQPPAIDDHSSNLGENLAFRSNGYTQPEAAGEKIPTTAVTAGYERIGENARLELYMHPQTFALQVRDRSSGYVWSSIPAGAAESGALNEEWQNAVHSPFLLEYINRAENTPRTTSLLGLQGEVVSVKPIPGGREITYRLPEPNISFTVRAALDNQGLVLSLPRASLREEGDGRLLSIQLYPFLGAVHKADVPGYLFVPDGSGALIRFSQRQQSFDEPYKATIYGADLGLGGSGGGSSTGFPVFGIVHGAGQNALFGIVEAGKANAQILAYPAGVNTDFYWAAPRFLIRYSYYQPTSKAMGGVGTFTREATEDDKSVRYLFLNGSSADYTGMALAYRAYLENKGVLVKRTEAEDESSDVPMEIEFFGGDIKPGLLGRQVVQMTPFREAKAILEDLNRRGVRRIVVRFKGWSSGGLNGARPAKASFERKLGGSAGFEELRRYAAEHGLELSLTTDYTVLLKGGPRADIRADAARAVNGQLISYPYVSRYVSDLYQKMRGYLLSPRRALQLAASDFAAFRERGVAGVSLEHTGSLLFSDHRAKTAVNRTEMAELTARLTEEAVGNKLKLSAAMPGDIALKGLSAYRQMPLESSRFLYATDTVPFLPLALHGYLDYFTDYLNNQTDPTEQMLRMVEYGAYPSFLITAEPSRKLRDTPSGDLFSTAYADWADELQRQYREVGRALGGVRDRAMTGHTALAPGVVKVTYEGGAAIWVNYTDQDYQDGAVSVKARDFTVKEGTPSCSDASCRKPAAKP